MANIIYNAGLRDLFKGANAFDTATYKVLLERSTSSYSPDKDDDSILDAAGLSFIGLGVRPPEPEWGGMIAEGVRYIASGEWWMFLFPGLAIFIAILGFNLLTDGMRDVMDPKLRR